MTRFTLAFTASLLAFPAIAADVADIAPVIEDNPAVAESFSTDRASHDWSGIYVGLSVGGAKADVDFLASPDGEEPLELGFDNTNFIGGGQIGYNVQFGQFVLGIEASLFGTGLSDKESIADVAVPGDELKINPSINWIATVGGRVGYAFDRVLVYGTGGIAFADADVKIAYEPGSQSVNHSDTYKGWTVGAGLEYALTENISMRGEYKYLKFDDQDFDLGVPSEGSLDVGFDVHAVKVGMNYTF